MKLCGLSVTAGMVCGTEEHFSPLTPMQKLWPVLSLGKHIAHSGPALSRHSAFGNLELTTRKY